MLYTLLKLYTSIPLLQTWCACEWKSDLTQIGIVAVNSLAFPCEMDVWLQLECGGRSLCVSHVWTLAVGSSEYSERSFVHNDGYHSVFLFLGFLAFQTIILMLPILVVMDDTSCWGGHGASLSFAISSPHWRTTSPPPHRMDMRLPIEMTGPQPSPREMKKPSWTRRFKKNQNEPLVTHSNQTVDNYYSILKAPLGCLVFSTLIIYLCKRLDCSAWYIYL